MRKHDVIRKPEMFNVFHCRQRRDRQTNRQTYRPADRNTSRPYGCEVKTIEAQCGKFKHMYLLLAGNDTVPTSLWRGGGAL